MTDYQLMQFATRVGYTIETVDGEDAFDPGSASHLGTEDRIRWPGIVLNIPTLREDYGHQDYQPLGSDADPQIVAQHFSYYEVEIESLMNANTLTENGSGFNDLFALAQGVWADILPHDGTGAAFVVGETVTGAGGGVGTVLEVTDANTLVVQRTTPALIFNNPEVLTGTTGGPTNINGAITNTIFLKRPLQPFTTEYGWEDPDDPTATGDSWFYRLRGCKIDSITITARPNDLVMVRIKIFARFRDEANTETVGAGGQDKISDLVEHTNPGLHYKDITWIITDSTGVIPDLDITEFDITFTNNVMQVPADNQQFEVAKLIEGKRRVTFNFKTIKRNNRLLAVSRDRPSQTTGQVRMQMTLDQLTPPVTGAYLSIDLTVSVLAERDAPLGQEIEFVEESFAGLAVGAPIINTDRP